MLFSFVSPEIQARPLVLKGYGNVKLLKFNIQGNKFATLVEGTEKNSGRQVLIQSTQGKLMQRIAILNREFLLSDDMNFLLMSKNNRHRMGPSGPYTAPQTVFRILAGPDYTKPRIIKIPGLHNLLAFSPDAKYFYTYHSKQVHIWDRIRMKNVKSLPSAVVDDYFKKIVITDDKRYFLFSSHYQLTIFDLQKQSIVRNIKTPLLILENLQMSPDGKHIYATGHRRTDFNSETQENLVYNFSTGKLLKRLTFSRRINNLSITPGFTNGTIICMEVKSGQYTRKRKPYTEIEIWELKSYSLRRKLRTYMLIRSLMRHPETKTLLFQDVSGNFFLLKYAEFNSLNEPIR